MSTPLAPGREPPATVSSRRGRKFRAVLAILVVALASGAAMALASEAASGPTLLAAARDAAHHDRNSEAAALFGEAVAAEPSLRAAVAREWADQLTWSGQSQLAEGLYREALAAPGLPAAEARGARLGLAFALSLNDALAEAQREYEALLASEPDDPEAARHLARVRSWRGRQREAAARFEAVLPALRGRHEWQHAMFDLARAQYWMGRPDRAQRTLAELLGAQPDHQGAKDLLAEMARGAQPASRAEVTSSSQSDHLDITSEAIEQEVRWRQGASATGLRFRHVGFSPETGEGAIDVDRPSLFLRHRLSDASELNLDLGVERIHQRDGAPDRDLLAFDAWFTYWPGDTLRLDLGAKRVTFDNLESLAQGITADCYSLSADLTPTERLRGKLKVEESFYIDGNRRRMGEAELSFRLSRHPEIRTGLRLTGFRFARRLDNGYFNPEDFLAAVVVLHGWGRLGERTWWDLDGTYGREHAHPDGDKPTASAAAKLTWQSRTGLELGLQWNYFSSRLASSGGFARGTAGAFARYTW